MTLTAEPGALRGFARQLHRAADDTTAIKKYVGSHATQVTSGELIQIASGSHRLAVTAVNSTLAQLDTILGGSGPEVDAAADYYVATDRQAAAAVDRSGSSDLDFYGIN